MIQFRVGFFVAFVLAVGRNPLLAQEGTIIRNAVKEAMEIITTQAEEKGAGVLAKELAEIGGETGMREIMAQVAKEEGENGLKAMVRLTKEYGIDAIQAAKVSPRTTITFVERLSPDLAPGALRALTRESERTIIERLEPELVPAALEASARHPGIGAEIVDKLGVVGARASQQYDTDAIIQLARSAEADAISKLPRLEKRKLAETIADFMEKHPTIILGATTLAVFEAHSREILGGKGTVVYDANGKPVFVPEIGIIERLLSQILRWLMPIVAAILALFGANRLYWSFKLSRLSHGIKSAKQNRISDKDIPPDAPSIKSHVR